MIATHYLPQMFETEKECTREAVRYAEYYAVTTDLWTSRAKHAYTSIGDFSLQSRLLGTKEFADNHTATNIAEELEVILKAWNLPMDKLSAATTDSGSNVVLAAEIREWQWMPA